MLFVIIVASLLERHTQARSGFLVHQGRQIRHFRFAVFGLTLVDILIIRKVHKTHACHLLLYHQLLLVRPCQVEPSRASISRHLRRRGGVDLPVREVSHITG